jgi:hypothetical protein
MISAEDTVQDDDIVITKKFQRVMAQVKGVIGTIVVVIIFVGAWVLRVESHARSDEIERVNTNSEISVLKSDLSEIKKSLQSVSLSAARIEGQLTEMQRRK